MGSMTYTSADDEGPDLFAPRSADRDEASAAYDASLIAAVRTALGAYPESTEREDMTYTPGWCVLDITNMPDALAVVHYDTDEVPFDELSATDQAAYCEMAARYQTALNGAGLCATWHAWGDGSPYLMVRAAAPPYDAQQDPVIIAALWGDGAGAVALHPVVARPPLAEWTIDPMADERKDGGA